MQKGSFIAQVMEQRKRTNGILPTLEPLAVCLCGLEPGHRKELKIVVWPRARRAGQT
jgi:hypothetical protein